MHEVGAENGNVLLEPGQHGLADTKRLDRLFIRTGQQMFVVRRGQAEDVAENMGQGEMHRTTPFTGHQYNAGRPT
jgi:hypothetical protein